MTNIQAYHLELTFIKLAYLQSTRVLTSGYTNRLVFLLKFEMLLKDYS